MYYMGAEEFARTLLAKEYENFIDYINSLEESQYKDYVLNNYKPLGNIYPYSEHLYNHEISYDTQIRI